MGGGSGYPAAPGGVYAMPAPAAAGGGGHFMIPAYPMGAYGPGKNMASPIMGNVLPAMGGHQQQQQHPHQQGGGGGLGFNSRGGMQQLRPHNRRGGMPGSSKQLVHFDESLAATQTVDRAIVSALKQPQHRLLLLEIEPAIHKMITETDSERLKLTNPLGKYQRMLIHKLGDYFRMDREVDYAKGSDMCTVTLVRTERTCVPNTILQELCRSALEAAEMADGGQPWPYVPRQQQQQQSHSRQQQESDSNVARRSVERAHSDEGVLEGGVDEHCSDVRGTCSEGGASAERTPSETGEDPAAATAGVKRRGVKILRRGPGSKGKNTRASRPDESSSDEGGKYSEANLLHNLPVDLREEHYNKIRAKIFQEDDGTPLVYSNEDLAAMESARKHIPKGTDLDDPE
ncbi:hypothetical protein Pmar_PMAR006445 [Perkinsus marinus ATCC 50983]|uniref:R3H domain-containing protein n=1 Tax=Perkinsus marinus (strain ATCC 50983 / TXsc) TaxID=423536 RepID=C5K9P9_PERM5|nr:hypothetical protein Pmar_PMAR006445 [Perkinsus marinus ATCC 50983]EER18821.1 hypothetical protein Pmar_PMAR006445 [Perkinsus marinus ATCC 50983]|eukprot:XP_002787025.1 hypothetical protein Pmar_PMAR006445 [Perkinsus marinus ATCC 50983]